MTLALSWGNKDEPEKPSGFIYFDAISLFTRDYKGRVTKHPVASGNSISDHFIKDNDTINISGIISGTDLSTFTDLIRDIDLNIPYNVYDNSIPVSINSSESDLFKLLPDVIGQFFTPDEAGVELDMSRTDVTEGVENSLINLMSGLVYNQSKQKFESNIQLVDLYEFKGTVINNITSNLVVTTIRFREDAKTGSSLFFDMQLEQVTFATLKKGKLPKDVQNSLKKTATPKQKKGSQDSTVGTVDANTDDTTTLTGRNASPIRVTPQSGYGLGDTLP